MVVYAVNIVDILQYTVLPYNSEIAEPAGLNIFLKLKVVQNWKYIKG
jgi:hypothetical protein